jgi:hypothetical protein
VTDSNDETRHDRALWDRYRRDRARAVGPPLPEGESGGAADINAIAAFLDGSADAWDRADFERRLADEPALLDRLLAARAAIAAEPTAPPAAVTAFALKLHAPRDTATASAAPGSPAAAPSWWRRWFWQPAAAWSTVGVLIAAAASVTAYLAVETEAPVSAAKGEPDTGPDPLVKELERTGNSIFIDPSATYFDGTDVD